MVLSLSKGGTFCCAVGFWVGPEQNPRHEKTCRAYRPASVLFQVNWFTPEGHFVADRCASRLQYRWNTEAIAVPSRTVAISRSNKSRATPRAANVTLPEAGAAELITTAKNASAQ
jgi:hypothetical protein